MALLPPVSALFRIHYDTLLGQQLAVQLDDGSMLPLQWEGGEQSGWWSGTLRSQPSRRLRYKYVVLRAGRQEREELAWRHLVLPVEPAAGVTVQDCWEDATTAAFSSSAFTDVIFKRESKEGDAVTEKLPVAAGEDGVFALRLRTKALRLPADFKLAIAGNVAALGSWDAEAAPAMTAIGAGMFVLDVEVRTDELPLQFKLISKAADGSVRWEDGANRFLTPAAAPLATAESRALVLTMSAPRFPHRLWRGFGVAIPVFSLRSEQSLGVGEFADLPAFIDWVRGCGGRMVQLLPVNDTSVYGSWRDSYPYNAVSVFALHPMYIRIADLPNLSPAVVTALAEAAAEPAGATVDYESVMEVKLRLLRLQFDSLAEELLTGGAAAGGSAAAASLAAFCAEHRDWLLPYALFCCLRDQHGSTTYTDWPAPWQAPSWEDMSSAAEEVSGAYHHEALFWMYVQQQAHAQLAAVSCYARDAGVVIKGDLPIGVSRYSVDTWVHPSLFNLDSQTGAPPDYFAEDGQNWGFPTYNWEAMARDGYAWWRRRLSVMALYFHAYRIDHILGFFRIWQLPGHAVSGRLGVFSPATPVWQDELEARGVWDMDRLVKPYIRSWRLEETFGAMWHSVASRYMQETAPSVWEFKPEYATEAAIEALVQPTAGASEEEVASYATLREQLCAFVTNVILIRCTPDWCYAFRIEMEKTTSFLELSTPMKHALKELYVDYFFKRQESLWRAKAMQKLPMMKSSSRMLVCGEDLGMIPDCVPGVMAELGLLSLLIERMPREGDFGDTGSYPYLSVCSPGTHDTEPLREWWEDCGVTQLYYNSVLGRDGDAPAELTAELAEQILWNHAASQSMWCVYPLQDLLAIDEDIRLPDGRAERINVPSNPRHYWRYRMHLSISELAAADKFNAHVRRLLEAAERVM